MCDEPEKLSKIQWKDCAAHEGESQYYYLEIIQNYYLTGVE